MYDTPFHKDDLSQFSFLVTGGAGFIGSNLVEYLLKYNAGKVRVLDNFLTGFHHNIEEFKSNPAFELLEGDIRDISACQQAVNGIDYVSHQAALGSVPRSIKDPLTTNEINTSGFLNMLCAVKDSKNIKRFIYAASSSIYGDIKELPKVEQRIGKPLSPYAVTKYVNELYAGVFSDLYGIKTIGLRYFNVFGPKQSPEGTFAAVVPLFFKALREDQPAVINGDGEQTRDFTFVENVIQANVKSFFVDRDNASGQVFNIAYGVRTSLNDLWKIISEIEKKSIAPLYIESREGDVRDSLADISKAKRILGYGPLVNLKQGLEKTFQFLNINQ